MGFEDLCSTRIVPRDQFAIWTDPELLRHWKRPDAPRTAAVRQGRRSQRCFGYSVRGRRVLYIQTSPLSTTGPCGALPKCDNAAVVQTHSGGSNENRTSQVFRPGRRCHENPM